MAEAQARPLFAVRWARRTDRFSNVHWSKWHWIDGNASWAVCGAMVVPFLVDGSPETHDDQAKVTCKHCRARIITKGATP